MKPASEKLSIITICDGLHPEWIRPEYTPCISELRDKGLWCADHCSVFPSVTRNAAASLTTGCRSDVHGLHGNTMALIEHGRFVVRDVGQPDFRHFMRMATGTTLRVPALPERVRERGVSVVFSNVSPGAAYFLDPENFGWVYHRAGSYAPGGESLEGELGLNVSHDLAGDKDMTTRFCDAIATRSDLVLGTLWLANPDTTAHNHPLGSPEYVEAVRSTDKCVRQVADAVAELRGAGKDVLFLVGSDHGMETIYGYKDLCAELVADGFGNEIDDGRIAVATQGTGALLYAAPDSRARMEHALECLSGKPWVNRVIPASGLREVGQREHNGLFAAVDMGHLEMVNSYGVRGMRWGAASGLKGPLESLPTGIGMHGGLGIAESRPFLIAQGLGYAPGSELTTRSSLVDIAPTVLDFLDIQITGMEGAPLLERA